MVIAMLCSKEREGGGEEKEEAQRTYGVDAETRIPRTLAGGKCSTLRGLYSPFISVSLLFLIFAAQKSTRRGSLWKGY